MISIIKDTFREAFAKKILLSVFVVISLMLLLFLAFINLDTTEAIQSLIQTMDEDSFKDAILKFETSLISQIPFFTIFILFIIITSSFVPSMVEKGKIDLLLSKPISRTNILLGKYFASVTFVFIILTYLIGIIWLMISAKAGIWHFQFLYSIVFFTLIFAVMYSFILLIGLITENTILTLIINLILFFPISAVLSIREDVFKLVTNSTIQFIFNFLYYIFPKPWTLRNLTINLIEGNRIETWEPLITSVIFCLAALSYSIYYFSKKDY